MTSREARTRRRAEERRQAKLARKSATSPNRQFNAAQSVETTKPLAHFNPDLENEFPRELKIEANAIRERIHRNAGLEPVDGFVSHSVPEPSKRSQINRANALHSTGPKSPEGKLASSGNSLKHGLASGKVIIPGEDPDAFETLLRDLLDEYRPSSPTEELLVNEMAQSYWLAQRALRFQNECFSENGVDEKRLALFLRYQTTHDHAFHKALSTLLRLRSGRACPAPGFVSKRPNRAAHEVSGLHAHGFVPQHGLENASTQAVINDLVRPNHPNTSAQAA